MADILHNKPLTPPQSAAIVALLSEPTIRKAAAAAAVKERTLFNWLKTRAFADEYRSARRESVQQATARLQHASSNAVGVLLELMQSESPLIRLRAACQVLDLATKAIEIDDLDSRISALERNEERPPL